MPANDAEQGVIDARRGSGSSHTGHVARLSLRHFMSYALLSYFEKALVFGFPLFALYVTGSKAAYNQVEYTFALAAVVALFLDGGLRIYLLQAYRVGGQSQELIQHIISSFRFLLRIYLIVAAFLLAAVLLFVPNDIFDIGAAAARALFLCMMAVLAVWYRIKDVPEKAFIYSIPVYLLGGVLIWLTARLELYGILLALVLPHLAAVIFVAFPRDGEDAAGREHLERFLMYAKASLRYGWPVLVSIVVTMLMANFGKIYAYKNLSENEMFQFSLAQRMALVVQLMHVSITGYMSKHLFVSESRSFHVKALAAYLGGLLLTSAAMIAFIYLAPRAGLDKVPKIDKTFMFIFAYMLVWCVGAYTEIYVNRQNRNVIILQAALVSAAVFAAGLILGSEDILLRIAMSMFSGVSGYLLYILFGSLYLDQRRKSAA